MALLSRPGLLDREFYGLWLLAAVTYGVGDTVTTIAIMEYSRSVVEANAVVRAAVAAFDTGGLAALKAGVILTCLAMSVHAARDPDERLLSYGPPLLLVVVGTFATVHNARLLLG